MGPKYYFLRILQTKNNYLHLELTSVTKKIVSEIVLLTNIFFVSFQKITVPNLDRNIFYTFRRSFRLLIRFHSANFLLDLDVKIFIVFYSHLLLFF